MRTHPVRLEAMDWIGVNRVPVGTMTFHGFPPHSEQFWVLKASQTVGSVGDPIKLKIHLHIEFKNAWNFTLMLPLHFFGMAPRTGMILPYPYLNF
jgi:hypothetical protein